jgi:type I restriction enzyme, R subunit
MVAFEEVTVQANDLFYGDHPDSSVRNVVSQIEERLEGSETVQQLAQTNFGTPHAGVKSRPPQLYL